MSECIYKRNELVTSILFSVIATTVLVCATIVISSAAINSRCKQHVACLMWQYMLYITKQNRAEELVCLAVKGSTCVFHVS